MDEFFDSLMCTNYYKKFEPEFRHRINEEPEYNTGQYISINFYDSSKDIYDNIKENYFFGLKEIAKGIRKKEKLSEQLKFLKSQPLDNRTNLQIKIIEANLKSHEELKLLKPRTSEKPIAISEKKSVHNSFNYDVFICHASEDKESFVRVLAVKLQNKGFKVWYDDFTLTLGDSLRRKIDRGLVNSRYGVVVLSKKFFEKEWPQKELDGLVAREEGSDKVILPIWHGINKKEVTSFSPLLADRLAVSSDKGIDYVVNEIAKVFKTNSDMEIAQFEMLQGKGIGGTQTNAPTASITAANNPDTASVVDLKIQHKGGDTLKGGDWKLSIVPSGTAPNFIVSASGSDFAVGRQIIATTTTEHATGLTNIGLTGVVPLSSGVKYDVKLIHMPSKAMLVDLVVKVR